MEAPSVRPARSSVTPPSSRLLRPRQPSFEALPPPPVPPRVPLGLALGALGVVYGDLGTNPLFALQECFGGSHPLAPTQANVLGILSLVFWALTAVVTIKYLTFVMRASNDGEGGILALLALVPGKGKAKGARAERPLWLVLLVLFGAALLYGDGVVTPAISVLSAVEGLKIAAPALSELVVPLTAVILVGLFFAQKKGTEGIGYVFGPLMVFWFVSIGVLGLLQVVKHPVVLTAIDPRHAIAFFVNGGKDAFLLLGAIVLCIAGGEALYADMGHFGRRPIAIAWYALVVPALLLNYFGQGAYLVAGGSVASASSPFYAIVPAPALIPMIVLATFATVIASQALISGAYSLTHQAVQLGFYPRVTIVHTSSGHAGQIYVPSINWMLMIASVALVVGFGASEKLAAAYGLAVTGTMSITSIAYFVVLTRTWKWPLWKAIPLVAFFLSFDLAFLTANLSKFFSGGWVPVSIGMLVFVVMTSWLSGRKRMAVQFASAATPFQEFIDDMRRDPPPRVRGTAVFMTANPQGMPPVLRHHYKHNQVLHERVVLLSIQNVDAPFVLPDRRITMSELGEEIHLVVAKFGFMEAPDVPALMRACVSLGLDLDLERMTYYLGREALIVTPKPGMAQWRKWLFSVTSRNARSATAYFGIPPERVVELGMQIEI